jgi:polyhydroxybutyrate depolymerase
VAARILGVLLIVAGCAAPLGFVEGSTSHTMSAGGLDRSYRLYIPAGSRHRPHRWSS